MASEYDSYSDDFEDVEYKDEDFEEYSTSEGDETELETELETEISKKATVRTELEIIGGKHLPTRTAKILVERIRSSTKCSQSKSPTHEQASLTYSALLPNIESWSAEGQFSSKVRRRHSRSSVQSAGHAVPSHLVDRLKIESLTLSMEKYDADQRRYKPEANFGVGLSRMVQVVNRKHRVPLSPERLRDLYNPAAILAKLAESHRQALERFQMDGNEKAIQV